MALLPISARDFAAVLNVLVVGFVGANVGAFYRGGAMISRHENSRHIFRQYAHFVIGQVQLFKSFSVLLIPPLYRLCVPNEEFHEYRFFFLVNVAFFTIGCVVFLIFASDKPEKFAIENTENSIDSEKTLPQSVKL